MIIGLSSGGTISNNLSKMIASRDRILDRSELANVDVVKDNQVYCQDYIRSMSIGSVA
ncbi:MAG: hypothetical protein ACP5OM_07600 [Methanothrix sp.]